MGKTMRGSDVAKVIENLGGAFVRRGATSHARYRCACGMHFTTVTVDKTIPIGTLKRIQRDLAGCANFGKGWLGV